MGALAIEPKRFAENAAPFGPAPASQFRAGFGRKLGFGGFGKNHHSKILHRISRSIVHGRQGYGALGRVTVIGL